MKDFFAEAPRIFYDVVVKYSNETKEKVTATIGDESRYCEDILDMFREPNLEYVRIEPSVFWKSKRERMD